MAFRKVNGMARNYNATPQIFRKLAANKGKFHLKYPGGGKHVEVDISKQVMALANHGKAQHVFAVSTGAPATPTIRGHFHFYRKDPGYNSERMYYSVYFIRGYATHGYDPGRPTPRATAASATRSPTRSSSTTGSRSGTRSGLPVASGADDVAWLDGARETLLAQLRKHALVIGDVTLSSGQQASYYVDARRALLRPEGSSPRAG